QRRRRRGARVAGRGAGDRPRRGAGHRDAPSPRVGPAAGVTRVLAVSSHGLLGGSELYLARLLTALGDRVDPHVVVLQDGPFVAHLRDLGIATTVIPT